MATGALGPRSRKTSRAATLISRSLTCLRRPMGAHDSVKTAPGVTLRLLYVTASARHAGARENAERVLDGALRRMPGAQERGRPPLVGAVVVRIARPSRARGGSRRLHASCIGPRVMSQRSLRILIIDENAVRAAILEEGLRVASNGEDGGTLEIHHIRDMTNLLRAHRGRRSRRHPHRSRESEPRYARADVSSFASRAAADRDVRRQVRQRDGAGRHRCRRVRVRRRWPAQGAREVDPRRDDQPIPCVRSTTKRAAAGEVGARGAQDHRASEGDPHEGSAAAPRTMRTCCCGARR